jgi:hypothetical protein
MEQLIYGVYQNNILIAKREEAEKYAAIFDAIPNSKTWADFIRLTSQEIYEEVMYRILDVLEHESLFPHFLMGEDLTLYVEGLTLPTANDEFSTDLLPGWDEGEFFPRFEEEIISWLPEDAFLEMGKVEESSEEDRFTYRIIPESLPLVIQSLEACNYSLMEDLPLILKAGGFSYEHTDS